MGLSALDGAACSVAHCPFRPAPAVSGSVACSVASDAVLELRPCSEACARALGGAAAELHEYWAALEAVVARTARVSPRPPAHGRAGGRQGWY